MNQKVDIFEAERTFSLGWKSRVGILVASLVALGVFVYPETLRGLFTSVLHREGSSHGLFVPFISGYLLWLKREKIKRLEPSFSLLPGTVAVIAGFLFFILSRDMEEVTLPALSFMLVVAGLFLALFGTETFKEIRFPLFFLIAMIPLPHTIYDQVGEWMREATTSGSVWLMQAFNLPVYREGYTVQLQNTSLIIAMSCSGIRYLLSYFVFSLAYAYLFKSTMRSRVLVVLASFPIALVAGVLRLSSIYLSTSYIGAFMAGHGPHILLSWSVFLVVLVVAVTVDQSLSRWRHGTESIEHRA